MIRIRPATTSDIEACTQVLVRAFMDDPGAIVCEPDPGRRRQIMPAFFRNFVTAAIADGGDIVVPTGTVDGIASWFGPETHGPSDAAMDAAGFAGVLETFGEEASSRI